MDVRPLHLPKARLPMLVTSFGMTIEVSLGQLTNAELPMLVTLAGIMMDVSSVQLENVWSAMAVRSSGSTTEVRDWHLKNADARTGPPVTVTRLTEAGIFSSEVPKI